RDTLSHELRKQRGTGKHMVPVPPFDLKFLNELAAGGVGTSNRRHQCPASAGRVTSRHPLTPTSEPNGNWPAYCSPAALRFEVPKRACGRRCRNFKSAALAAPRPEPPAPRHEAACQPLARFGSPPLVLFREKRCRRGAWQ